MRETCIYLLYISKTRYLVIVDYLYVYLPRLRCALLQCATMIISYYFSKLKTHTKLKINEKLRNPRIVLIYDYNIVVSIKCALQRGREREESDSL